MTFDIQVEIDAALGIPLPEDALIEAVRHVLHAEGVEAAEISIACVDDAQIAQLNQDYLGRDGPTDVISFPLHLAGDPPLGDIYLGVDQARRHAEALGVPLAEELLRLAVHGTLHVLGHDHPDGEERLESPMFIRQEALLREILSGWQREA
jgi:probable rRNA maturation factor